MNKEFELDENGNAVDKITYEEVMSIMAAAGYKSKLKRPKNRLNQRKVFCLLIL